MLIVGEQKVFFSLSMTQHFNDRLPPRRRTKLLIKLVLILKKKNFFSSSLTLGTKQAFDIGKSYD
jgi:hypothetical protein